MDLTPLLSARQPVPLHALAAGAGLGLGAVQLAMPKGTRTHRRMGRVWVGLMALVAGSSLFIYDFRLIGPFSPIHLLSLFVLYSIVRLVMEARAGDVAAHARRAKWLYGLALVVTGLVTLLPGRVMHDVMFGGA